MRVKLSHCSSCGKPLDGVTSVKDEEAKPKPGSFSICIYCGHVTAFADDLSLRELTDEEMREIAGRADILAIQKARAIIDKRKLI